MTVEDWLGKDNELGIDIWHRKYQHNDETFEEWLDRVSGHDDKVRDLIILKRFLFAGRILAYRGIPTTDMHYSMSNCYVLKAPEDNIESIYQTCGDMARTFSYGGGVGIDISKLRPRGAPVHNAAKSTSGAVSFMDTFSKVAESIGQGGRRAALMISLSCDHPDVEEFIRVKTDLTKINFANISLRMTDEFMNAADRNEDYELHFKLADGNTITKQVNARDILMLLAKTNWDYGEPGCLFWDRIKNWCIPSNDPEFSFGGTNPCAEEPLPEYGCCLLGSMNISEYVVDGKFDLRSFANDVPIAIRALNKVLDEGLSLHPLKKQRETARDWRQIGLGQFGLGDALIKLGIRYGSIDAVAFCDNLGETMAIAALRESERIATLGGVYPMYSEERLAQSEFLKQHNFVNHKLHNSALLSIAPTGTLSTMLGVSGGIEPLYATSYERRTVSLHDEEKTYKVYPKVVSDYIKRHKLKDDTKMPEYFVTAQTINYKERIAMQAAWQTHVDAAISSTINLPNSATVEDVFNIYMEAWKAGLKGVTVFRDGCARLGILTTSNTKKTEEATTESTNKVVYDSITPVSRKVIGTTHGSTFCKKCACGTLYITVNMDDDGNVVETFVHTSKGGICQANINAINRMVSLALRGGVKVSEVIDQLKGINCPACTKASTSGRKLDGISCPDIISRTIHEFVSCANKTAHVGCVSEAVADEATDISGYSCPECGHELHHEGGCVICTECGYSKCS